MTKAYAHYAWSFPSAFDADNNQFGWSEQFLADLRADHEGGFAGVEGRIRRNADTLDTKGVLVRGSAGCRLPRWPVGQTFADSDGGSKAGGDGPSQSRPIESGVLTSCALDAGFVAERNAMLRRLTDDGFEIVLHTGPATSEAEAVRSAALDVMSGAKKIVVDSSARNAGVWVALQLRCIELLGGLPCLAPAPVGALVEPTVPANRGPRPALANVRFVEEEIARGRDVSMLIAWLNDPDEWQRANMGQALGPALKAGVGGYGVPVDLMLRAKKGSD